VNRVSQKDRPSLTLDALLVVVAGVWIANEGLENARADQSVAASAVREV